MGSGLAVQGESCTLLCRDDWYVRFVTDYRDDRIGSALRGENPTVVSRLPGSFAVMGDPQWLPGYCVLLADNPHVRQLSDLSRPDQLTYLTSLALLGEAVEAACRERDRSFRRVNLEILGNQDDFLHAHVWPRYEWEPPELVHKPVWLYPAERWSDPSTRLGAQHDGLKSAIAAHLAGGWEPPTASTT